MRVPRPGLPRRRLSLCSAVLLLAGCTSGSGDGDGDGEGPEATAQALAQGLGAKDLTGVPLSARPGPGTALATLLGSMAEVPAAVAVSDVEESGEGAGEGAAVATLDWAWELPGGERWSYESTASLVADAAGEWAVDWQPSVVEPSLRDGETLDLDELAPDRGDILGRGGSRLVTEREVFRYGLDKTQVRPAQVAGSARRIAALLDVDATSFVAAARAAGAEAFVEAIVLRTADARRVDPAYATVPGAVALRDAIPLAPTREFAAPLLGTVGEATAEVIEESGGTVGVGDLVGLSGLQERHDEQLRGQPGLSVQAVDAQGTERELHVVPPENGAPLRTTLDARLQRRAERILAGVPLSAGATALVALEPSTGQLLAAANGPGTEGLNIATFGYYPPGSTFKVVSALALLRSGIGPEDPVDCPATVVVDGREFSNYDDYPSAFLGRITLRQAVANSCNTAMIGAGTGLGEGDLAAAAAALGFGVDHDVGFPALFGEVPPPASETVAAADLIGQGTVVASPLAMAVVAASVQAGRAVLPVLVPGYQVDQSEPEQPLTGAEARQLRLLMRAVVTSGSGSQLADLPGQVGAKTGTAEYGEPGRDGELPTHAWMIGFSGDLAVAAFVETGQSGSRTAGPLLEAFLRGA